MLQPITPQEFTQKHWQRYTSYAFAATQTITPLVAQELPKAVHAFPIALMQQGTGFVPVAVQGLVQGRNVLVGPQGQWLSSYVPAAHRGHPFSLAPTAEGQLVLCVQADSPWANTPEGEDFVDAQGQLSAATASVFAFLKTVAADHARTAQLCALLQQHGLIKPWAITLQGDAGTPPVQVQGLHCVDEAKLQQLDAATLHTLHQSGALVLAYCQLMSMQHLHTLGKLAQAQAAQAAQAADAATALPTTASGELDLEFLNQGGTLRFGA